MLGAIRDIFQTLKKWFVGADKSIPMLQDCTEFENSNPHIGSFNALVIADSHGNLVQGDIAEKLQRQQPDIIFLLGDNFDNDLDVIQDYFSASGVPMVSVAGNHDFKELLSEHGITDLHLKTMEWNGFTIGGFGGSIRYKEDSRYTMYTNEESEQMFADMPRCDIC